ncbi:DUF421 domain-containing protein [Clostridiaceae bacterium 35-E11]
MEMTIYIARCIIMLMVAWAGARMMGKKSIAEMTSYDLVALMLFTTVAAEPLVYKIPSKASIGVAAIVIATTFIGMLSLKKFFYHLDTKPIIVIVKGQILEKELQRIRMNIPLLVSELRQKGYQNVADVEFAILEPSGKLSVIPKSQARPVQPSDLTIATSPVNLSFPIIIDGKINKENLAYAMKDEAWLMEQLKMFGVDKVENVLLAQMDSQSKLYVDKKHKEVKVPNVF